MEIFDEAFKYFLSEKTTITKTCIKFKIKQEDFIQYLHSKRYYKAALRISRDSIIKYHNAAEEYANSEFWNIPKKEVCDKYGISRYTDFKEYMEKYYPQVRVLNHNIFDSIDNEEKAYWLGFFFADGWLCSYPIDNPKKTAYAMELSLSIKDIDHVKKFRDFIEYKREGIDIITKYRLCFNSQHMWNTLNNYGCTPRKSLTVKFPKEEIFIPSEKYSRKELIRHFIRGFWDGNGCLTYKRPDCPTITLVSTESFLTSVQKYLGTNKTLYYNSKDNEFIKVLKYNGTEAFKITHYLYKNSNVYLDRKYEKYKNEYCRLYEELYRELQTNNGEDCDVNPVISTETKESVPSYRVETEPSNEE